MVEWFNTHSTLVNMAINATLLMVWAVYLNLFLFGTLRTRRPMILMSRSAGKGLDARLFISNMGAEPIYITAMVADCEWRGGFSVALITQNDDIASDSQRSPEEATNEGPLGPGQYMDAGSFSSLMKRVSTHAAPSFDRDKLTRVTFTVVAATGHSAEIAGGRKSYTVIEREGRRIFHPESLSTEQLRGRWQARKLRARLNRELRSELREAQA